VAGFVGVPAVLGGGNAIHAFLEPSFSPPGHVEMAHAPDVATAAPAAAVDDHGDEHAAEEGAHGAEGHHAPVAVELGLMAFSVAIGIIGILLAYRFYVQTPEVSEAMAARWAGLHRVLTNKYYVDEAYDATVIGGTMASARGLWAVDRTVVDGAVNGTGRLTIVAAWFSGLTDRSVVDGAVNLVARAAQELSYAFRRVQTGLIQNYALLMLVGVFAFVTVYLFVR